MDGQAHGSRFKDLTNEPPFGRLKVIRLAGRTRHGAILWECLCDPQVGGCGAIAVVRGTHLRSSHTKSCGCDVVRTSRAANTTHGMTHTPEYQSWYGMKQRCSNKRHKSFADYGGRGIQVCERWMSFENFLLDMGRKPSAGHSIERRESDGHYCPDNCIWATRREQNSNTRRNTFLTLGGRSMTISDWARELNVMPATICKRLKRGWPLERALA